MRRAGLFEEDGKDDDDSMTIFVMGAAIGVNLFVAME